MSHQNRQRRLRGTGKETVALNVHIDPATKDKIDSVADALGRTQGQILDVIVGHSELDDVQRALPSADDSKQPPDAAELAHRRQRRTRGTGQFMVALNVRIDPSTKATIDRFADTLSRSQGPILDLILTTTNVDVDGRPDFWDGPLASEVQKELPLASSA